MADEHDKEVSVLDNNTEHPDWYQTLMARIDALQEQNANHFSLFASTMRSLPRPDRPWYMPDTKGFLAVAIIVLIGGIVVMLMFGKTPSDQQVMTLLTTVVGALLMAFKDVYGYSYGSSAGSAAKDTQQAQLVDKLTQDGANKP